ncbi:MAG: Asp23/Gls24 family envelope stress response protein [Clostridia bacterium]|nr:Asp23/Gls24 family envelope stress response protein [Clostridia bacterium]
MEENKNIIEEITLEEDTGKVNISDDVVATIAGIAAAEIEGVTGMSGGVAHDIAEMLGAKKSPQKGVKVSVTPEGATIDLYIVVAFGVRIPELAWEVQENVKNSVETMTGIDVQKVNVRIEGVSFEKEKKPEKKDDDVTEVTEQEIVEEIDLGEDLSQE